MYDISEILSKNVLNILHKNLIFEVATLLWEHFIRNSISTDIVGCEHPSFLRSSFCGWPINTREVRFETIHLN